MASALRNPIVRADIETSKRLIYVDRPTGFRRKSAFVESLKLGDRSPVNPLHCHVNLEFTVIPLCRLHQPTKLLNVHFNSFIKFLSNDINTILRILIIFKVKACTVLLIQNLQESVYAQRAVLKIQTLKCSRNLTLFMSTPRACSKIQASVARFPFCGSTMSIYINTLAIWSRNWF